MGIVAGVIDLSFQGCGDADVLMSEKLRAFSAQSQYFIRNWFLIRVYMSFSGWQKGLFVEGKRAVIS
jgi:hypothetical protein